MDGNKWAIGAAVIAAIGTIITAGTTGYSAYLTAQIQKQTSDRQSDIEMVKLALNILGGDISDKTQESRTFAVSLLEKYSGVPIDKSTKASWSERGTVIFSSKVLGLSSEPRMFRDLLGGDGGPELGMPNPGLRQQELPNKLNKN
ncbi:hypothetical protein QQF51_05100 [Brucella intermedia]|uniref:hypothetical protein n=1 Tax=Brucella intermedia TaxID=94625 RepID=UPI002553D045|nr:hypothetical protein [Brucella intermedia]MDL2202046.1 hypothetical protein [Brucella intermedia]